MRLVSNVCMKRQCTNWCVWIEKPKIQGRVGKIMGFLDCYLKKQPWAC